MAPDGYKVKEGSIKITERKEIVTVEATVIKDGKKALKYTLVGLKKDTNTTVTLPTPTGPKLEVKAADGIKLEEILPSELTAEQLKITATEGYEIKKDSIRFEDIDDKEATKMIIFRLKRQTM